METPDEMTADEADALRAMGATEADLVEHFATPLELRLVLTMLPGERVYTRGEAADIAGVDRQQAAQLRRTLGFPDEDPDVVVATERDVDFLRMLATAVEYMGERDVSRFMRTLGESATRIADAATSIFLLNVELPRRTGPNMTDPESIPIAGLLVDGMADALSHLVREKLVAVRRRDEIGVVGDYEVQNLAVGFADLANSTRLTESLSLAEIGDLLVHFEDVAFGAVNAHGGRLVKLIGDEVLFRAESASEALAIGVAIAELARDDEVLPAVRVGLAHGQVLTRSGDVFGTPVNLAARLVKRADVGSVLMTDSLWTEAGSPPGATPDRLTLAGFTTPITTRNLTP